MQQMEGSNVTMDNQEKRDALDAITHSVVVTAKKAKNDPDPEGSLRWADITMRLAKSYALISGTLTQSSDN
jgi:hypothetical protein